MADEKTKTPGETPTKKKYRYNEVRDIRDNPDFEAIVAAIMEEDKAKQRKREETVNG